MIQIKIGEIGQILATLMAAFWIWHAHVELRKDFRDEVNAMNVRIDAQAARTDMLLMELIELRKGK